jgi:divalent metal cation (Fe/Co/Zn/Cd) transporter
VVATGGTAAGTRPGDLRAALHLELVTVLWMVAEGAVAVTAGLAAGSVVLTAFGMDSLIELIAGGVVLWRVATEARGRSVDRVEHAERRARWVTASALVLLCGYVMATAALGLARGAHPSASVPGLVVACAAVPAMTLLAVRKRRLARRLDSAALRAEAACSVTCAYLALTVIVGLVLSAAAGWWWADGVAAVVLLCWLGPEAGRAARAAREGESGCGCG